MQIKKRFFILSIAIAAGLIICCIAFYTFDFKSHRVKKQLESYTAEMKALMANAPKHLTEKDLRAKFDELDDKIFQAESYLSKHAPALLAADTTIDKWQLEDAELEKQHLAKMHAVNPETAEMLSEILKNGFDATGAEQEVINLEEKIKADEERFKRQQAAWKAEKSKSDAFMTEIKRWLSEEREKFTFDTNGNITGIKDSSSFKELLNQTRKQDTLLNERPSESPSNPTPTRESSSRKETAPTWQDTLTTDMATLDIGFYESYPDVMIRYHLSDTEYREIFTTEDERRAVENRTQQLQSEYANRIKAFMKTTPTDRHSEVLKTVENELTRNWDADFAKNVIQRLQTSKQRQ